VSEIPICPESGEDVDDCPCVDVRDYDARDAADEREQQALDERDVYPGEPDPDAWSGGFADNH
jgi:hypothetical protein